MPTWGSPALHPLADQGGEGSAAPPPRARSSRLWRLADLGPQAVPRCRPAPRRGVARAPAACGPAELGPSVGLREVPSSSGVEDGVRPGQPPIGSSKSARRASSSCSKSSRCSRSQSRSLSSSSLASSPSSHVFPTSRLQGRQLPLLQPSLGSCASSSSSRSHSSRCNSSRSSRACCSSNWCSSCPGPSSSSSSSQPATELPPLLPSG
mmetsp:Transcript_51499/g.164917  ORF Transcript_51499/g.164917 Transcript_51499/m.164917 type:complete len:208 (-) Transcript_51499:41-664(-)